MAEIPNVDDHGLEVLRKAGFVPDDSKLTQYAFRTKMIDALEGSFRPSGLNAGGKVTEVTLDTSNWTALPTIALTNRNAICIQNKSGTEIKINYNNSVVGYVGIVISNGSERFYDITDDIIIYAKASSGTPTINIEEIA